MHGPIMDHVKRIRDYFKNMQKDFQSFMKCNFFLNGKGRLPRTGDHLNSTIYMFHMYKNGLKGPLHPSHPSTPT